MFTDFEKMLLVLMGAVGVGLVGAVWALTGLGLPEGAEPLVPLARAFIRLLPGG
jgi:hypothetical protein